MNTATTVTIEEVERAERTLAFIKAHEANWQQHDFIGLLDYSPERDDQLSRGIVGTDEALECGTAACFAGWHAILTGRKVRGYGGAEIQLDDGSWESVAYWAQDDLGLVGWGRLAHPHLFDSRNTLELLEAYIAEMRVAATSQRMVDFAAVQQRYCDELGIATLDELDDDD